jgi:hypothetical protein
VAFVQDVFKVTPDAWQVDVLREFAVSQRVAMTACKGPGKTAVISWCCWNFLVTRPYPKIAATSISGDNLADGLWAEMSKWQQKSDLLKGLFEWTKTRIANKKNPENWFMSARTWPKSADTSQQANTLAGLHADYILFVLDESGGIPSAVMAAAEAALSSGIECKILQAGNPTHLEGPLYDACTKAKHLWKVFNITGDPDDPNRSPRVSVEWAKQQIEQYGRDNPWVLVNVFGKFPPASINALLGPDDVKAAMRRRAEGYETAQKRLGIDVARFGNDSTIIFPRQGLMAFACSEMRGARTNEIAARVAQTKIDWGSEIEFVDETGGYGGGVVDALIQAGHAPVGVSFSGKAIDSRYLNKRAEMWFLMSEWVKRGGVLPEDDQLSRELTAVTYTFVGGKFQIEPKEQIVKRLGFSPDRADALALTFAMPEAPSANSVIGQAQFSSGSRNVKWDFDPFADRIEIL